MKKILVLIFGLALVAAIATPLAALADVAIGGATTINGTVASVAELNAPYGNGSGNAISFGTMTVGTNPASGITAGSVTDNNKSGFYVQVSSNTTDGKMTNSGATRELGTALSVTTGFGSATLTNVTVTSTPQMCVSSSVPAAINIPLGVSQTITTSDAADTYSIILTYTLTENP